MTDLQRNNQFALIFLSESCSVWRDWLWLIYPKGRKAIGLSLQTHQGWTEMRPDANTGFEITQRKAMTSSTGLWLRGSVAPRSCGSDVLLARTFMGWRRWHVSTWRVWAYRALAAAVMASASAGISVYLAGIVAILPFLVPSPMTPKGLFMYAEKRGFVPPALRPDLAPEPQTIFNPIGVPSHDEN